MLRLRWVVVVATLLLVPVWAGAASHGHKTENVILILVDGLRWQEVFMGADEIWIAILGPDTAALGENVPVGEVTISQIPATIAKALGEDYRADVAQAAGPIAGAVNVITSR
jgi:hypothetical protein